MPTFNEVKNKAVEVWGNYGVILPSVTLAQFILESASGTSALAIAANNLFGIKASAPWTGAKHVITSSEEVNGAIVPKESAFRKYNTWQESVQDHSDFFVSTEFRKNHYKNVIGKLDYRAVCNALATTYATDSAYGTKLISIIEKNNLAQYDGQGGSTVMTGKVIVIDDGHGGTDNGAAANAILEDAWNLEVCANIEQKLKTLGHTVYSTRSSDVYVGLTERATMANNWNADIFISCHVNAGGGTGYEDFIFDSILAGDTVTPDLQNKIHAAMTPVLTKYGMKDRGKKRANYAVLRETYMPAILLEAAFLDNATDAATLKSAQFKEDYAQAVVNGVQNFYGLATVVKPAPVPQPVPVQPAPVQPAPTPQPVPVETPKVVVQSTLVLPNGKNWTAYPTEGPFTVGNVISLEDPSGESSYIVLGERHSGRVLIIDLPNFGKVGLYFDTDKGAKVVKKYA